MPEQQLYAPQSPQLVIQSRMFEKEAIELWQIEKSIDSLTAVAGLIMLALALGDRGQGQGGTQYLNQASGMAGRLKLFGVPERIGVEDLGRLGSDEQQAIMHATWGAFNCVT